MKIDPKRQYKYKWPRREITWHEGDTLFISIPFTWRLPKVKKYLESSKRKQFKNVVIGGPAIKIIPDYFNGFDFLKIGDNLKGVLQRINPMATQTSVGCIRKCKFCAIGSIGIEGPFKELSEWPNLPVVIDNNILATSQSHFDKVIDRLKKIGWADFNSALDIRLINKYHAKRIAEIPDPLCRLAFDNPGMEKYFDNAFNLLRSSGIPESRIQVYCLAGFDESPDEMWKRAKFLKKYNVWVHPCWFHELNQMEYNIITDRQKKLGWNSINKTDFFQHFWFHGMKRFSDSF